MDGHAVFIWASYAVAALGLGGLVLASIAQHRRARRALEARGLDKRR